jgi:hypothetical protein
MLKAKIKENIINPATNETIALDTIIMLEDFNKDNPPLR